MKKLLLTAVAASLIISAVPLAACSKKKTEPRSNYDLSVSYNAEDGTLAGEECFTFYNSCQNELTELKFNLYGNAFREGAKYKPVSDSFKTRAYYAGESYGGLKISSVENCANWSVGGEDENILTVELNNPVYPGESVQVDIDYVLTAAKINHRTGITQNAVNLGNFYPVLCAYTEGGFAECPYYTCGDPFYSACANYTVTLDMPEGYTAASSGEVKNSQTLGGRQKVTYSLENARDFAMVLSDKFTVKTESCNGVEIKYYCVDESNAGEGLKAAKESLEYFSQTFGGYAYPTYSVVETGFCYGGMEYPALSMIAEGQKTPDAVYTTVHETAHQWWYAMVGNDQINCGWQDEGLAEYSTLMFFENNPDYGYTRAAIVDSATRAYRAFFSVYNQLNGKVDTTMNRCLKDFSGEFEYTNIAYNKPLIMFDILRKSVGDEKFTGCLRDYFNAYCFKNAPAEGLIASFTACGKDLEGIFNSFIEGKILI